MKNLITIIFLFISLQSQANELCQRKVVVERKWVNIGKFVENGRQLSETLIENKKNYVIVLEDGKALKIAKEYKKASYLNGIKYAAVLYGLGSPAIVAGLTYGTFMSFAYSALFFTYAGVGVGLPNLGFGVGAAIGLALPVTIVAGSFFATAGAFTGINALINLRHHGKMEGDNILIRSRIYKKYCR